MNDSTGFDSDGIAAILTVGDAKIPSYLSTGPYTPEFYLYLSSTALSQY
jgi:hypothetical protein